MEKSTNDSVKDKSENVINSVVNLKSDSSDKIDRALKLNFLVGVVQDTLEVHFLKMLDTNTQFIFLEDITDEIKRDIIDTIKIVIVVNKRDIPLFVNQKEKTKIFVCFNDTLEILSDFKSDLIDVEEMDLWLKCRSFTNKPIKTRDILTRELTTAETNSILSREDFNKTVNVGKTLNEQLISDSINKRKNDYNLSSLIMSPNFTDKKNSVVSGDKQASDGTSNAVNNKGAVNEEIEQS